MSGHVEKKGTPLKNAAVLQDACEISRKILGIRANYGFDLNDATIEFDGPLSPSSAQLGRLERLGIRKEWRRGTKSLRLRVDAREYKLSDYFFGQAMLLPRWIRARIIDAAPSLCIIMSNRGGTDPSDVWLTFYGPGNIAVARKNLSKIGIELGKPVDSYGSYYTYGATFDPARAAKAAGMCAIEAPA